MAYLLCHRTSYFTTAVIDHCRRHEPKIHVCEEAVVAVRLIFLRPGLVSTLRLPSFFHACCRGICFFIQIAWQLFIGCRAVACVVPHLATPVALYRLKHLPVIAGHNSFPCITARGPAVASGTTLTTAPIASFGACGHGFGGLGECHNVASSRSGRGVAPSELVEDVYCVSE